MTNEELEQMLESHTRDAPPDMASVIIESVRAFVADPDVSTLTIAKIEGDGKTHYMIDLS